MDSSLAVWMNNMDILAALLCALGSSLVLVSAHYSKGKQTQSTDYRIVL